MGQYQVNATTVPDIKTGVSERWKGIKRIDRKAVIHIAGSHIREKVLVNQALLSFLGLTGLINCTTMNG